MLQGNTAAIDIPLMTNSFAQQFMSAMGVLLPVGLIALLPSAIFRPAGRSAVVAAILVIAAAWSFYGAVVGAPVYFVAGVMASIDPNLGIQTIVLTTVPMVLIILGLTLYFWVRILWSSLALSGIRFFSISLVAVITEAFVFWLSLLVVDSLN